MKCEEGGEEKGEDGKCPAEVTAAIASLRVCPEAFYGNSNVWSTHTGHSTEG